MDKKGPKERNGAHLLAFTSAPTKSPLYDADSIPVSSSSTVRERNEPYVQSVASTKEEQIKSFLLSGLFQFVLHHNYWETPKCEVHRASQQDDPGNRRNQEVVLAATREMLGGTGPALESVKQKSTGSENSRVNSDVMPKWDKVKYVVVKSTYEEFVCPICLEQPVAPRISTTCGHVFCHPCLLQHLAGCKARREKEKEKERGVPRPTSRSPMMGPQHGGSPSPTMSLPPTMFSNSTSSQHQNHSINHRDNSRFLQGKDVGLTKSCCPLCLTFLGENTEVSTRPVILKLISKIPTAPRTAPVVIPFRRLRRWKNSNLCLPIGRRTKREDQPRETTGQWNTQHQGCNALLPVYGTDEAEYCRLAVDDHPEINPHPSSAFSLFSDQLTTLLEAQEQAMSDAAMTESMIMSSTASAAPATPARHVPVGATGGIIPGTGGHSSSSDGSSKKNSPVHSYSKVLSSHATDMETPNQSDELGSQKNNGHNFFSQEPFYARAVEILMDLQATYASDEKQNLSTEPVNPVSLLERFHYDREDWDESSHSIDMYQMADGNNVYLHSVPMLQLREEAWSQQFLDGTCSSSSSSSSRSRHTSAKSTPQHGPKQVVSRDTPQQLTVAALELEHERSDRISLSYDKSKGPHPKADFVETQLKGSKSVKLVREGVLPSVIELPVEELTEVVQTQLTRQQFPQTAHIPLYASFHLAFVDFRKLNDRSEQVYIRQSILSKFSNEYRTRTRQHMSVCEKERRYEEELERKSKMKERERERMEGQHYYFNYYSKPSNGNSGHFVPSQGDSEMIGGGSNSRSNRKKESLLSSADYCEFEASLANQTAVGGSSDGDTVPGRRLWEVPSTKAAQTTAAALSLDQAFSTDRKAQQIMARTSGSKSDDDGLCEPADDDSVSRVSGKGKKSKGGKRSKKNVAAEMGFF